MSIENTNVGLCLTPPLPIGEDPEVYCNQKYCNEMRELNEKVSEICSVILCHRPQPSSTKVQRIAFFPASADEREYWGEVVGFRAEGKGVLFYPSGHRYEGDVVNGQPHGRGGFYFADGGRYEGDFFGGKAQGKGVFYYRDGGCYTGDFVDGKRHGKGFFIYRNGARYEGEFREGKKTSKGVLLTADGCRQEGDSRDGRLNGKGKFIWPDGTCVEGVFKQDIMDCSESSIDQDMFICLLLGTKFNALPEIPLVIISSYLNKNGFSEEGKVLQLAWEALLLSSDNKETQAKLIFNQWQLSRKEFLLCYGCIHHVLGLGLEPKREGFVDCSLYNSGYGLEEFHTKIGSKFETTLTIRVPETAITEHKILQLLETRKTGTCEEAYKAITEIQGAQKMPSKTNITQSPQKRNNCTLEWIFAYLKNTMGERRYIEMRIQLFQDCIAAIRKKAQETNIPARHDWIQELERKIEKRKVKLAGLS